jgi:hypothetical protein
MNSPAQQQEKEISLEEELGNAFEQMESEDEVEEVEESSEEGEEEEQSEEAEETGEEKPEDEELKDEIEAAEESDYKEPAPERWPTEIKEVYNSLPPQARKAMLEGIYKPMQATYTKATQQLAEARKTIDPMLQSLNQYRNEFERMGQNPVDAIKTQMAWAAHFARVGPEQGLQDMASAYGLQQGQPKEDEQFMTPMERAMKERLDQLEGQTSQFIQSQQQNAQQAAAARQQQQVQQVNSAVMDFINETKDGQPAHPHVEKVAPAIAGLIRGGLIPSQNEYGQPIPVRDQLNAAYKMACNLDPSIRPAASQRQVARAKAAGDVGVVAKDAAGNVDAEGKSLFEDLSDTFEKMSRSVA